jgi:hypothetical protein
MSNLTLNLFALGCKSRSDIILRRDECDSNIAFIKYNGHTYMTDWKRFAVENFECPLTLIV